MAARMPYWKVSYHWLISAPFGTSSPMEVRRERDEIKKRKFPGKCKRLERTCLIPLESSEGSTEEAGALGKSRGQKAV